MVFQKSLASFEAMNCPIHAPSPYEVLCVSPSASREEIRAAYKARLLETHPDKPSGSRVAFDAVNAAYNILTSPALQPPTVIVDSVVLEDMDTRDDLASYPCRCGDAFVVAVADLSASSSAIVTCNGCSLSICVAGEASLP